MPGPEAPATGRRAAAGAAVAVSAVAVSLLPFSLLGASAVQIRGELGLNELTLGLAMGAFYGIAMLSSAVMGRLAGRMGAIGGLRAGVVLAAGSLTGVAVLTHRWEVLAAFLAAAGLALAILQPAADLWVTGNVPRHRHGVTYGVKQSAAPISVLVAGLAVPAVAIPLGWRWSYAAAAVVAVAVLALLPADASANRRRDNRAGDARVRTLLVIALSYALGNVGAVALGGFFVSHAVRSGVPEGVAGVLLAVSSLGVVLFRVAAGHLADRRAASPLVAIAALQGAGAACIVAFAFAGGAWVYVLGPLAMVAAWGWLGLLALTVVRENPGAPAAATGITQTGGYLGAGVGPVVFGLATRAISYHGAWVLVACSLGLAAVAMLAGRRLLRAGAPAAAGAPGRAA